MTLLPTKVSSSAGSVSYDSLNFFQLFLSVSTRASCSQHGHAVNLSSCFWLNELHSKETELFPGLVSSALSFRSSYSVRLLVSRGTRSVVLTLQ